ncbi:unnamed protein product [Plutella xylostella]|uniref:(diamondback moth) hypothetical protein n=1 Tax=Plutella xylostella TaxID=51655 RepID=A0A8S4FU35_PLUXY|nr:unnamed protein product [Plutella xylostella]
MIVERHTAAGRTRHRAGARAAACHYTGAVRGQPASRVALSACDGLVRYYNLIISYKFEEGRGITPSKMEDPTTMPSIVASPDVAQPIFGIASLSLRHDSGAAHGGRSLAIAGRGARRGVPLHRRRARPARVPRRALRL